MIRMAMFFLLFNLASGLVISSGMGAALNAQHETAGDSQVDNVREELCGEDTTLENCDPNVDTGGESENTLFGMYDQVTNTLSTLSGIITAGPAMLGAIGFPSIITNSLKVVVLFVYGTGIAQFLRGFSL